LRRMMSPFDEVSGITEPGVTGEISNLATEKYLQAVKMLTRARSLDPDHPDLHVRIAHLRNTGKNGPNSMLSFDFCC
jgi:hypothetical protein